MEEALAKPAMDTVSLDGLEELLDGQDTTAHVLSEVHADDWTIDEAADYLKVSTKTIRRHLAGGKLHGYKVPGANGLEWRVTQDSLDKHARQSRSDQAAQDIVQGNVESTVDTGLVKVLQAEIERLREDNQTLIYRTGYLQAQIEQREKTIILLEDRSRVSWWRRVWSAMKGAGG